MSNYNHLIFNLNTEEEVELVEIGNTKVFVLPGSIKNYEIKGPAFEESEPSIFSSPELLSSKSSENKKKSFEEKKKVLETLSKSLKEKKTREALKNSVVLDPNDITWLQWQSVNFIDRSVLYKISLNPFKSSNFKIFEKINDLKGKTNPQLEKSIKKQWKKRNNKRWEQNEF